MPLWHNYDALLATDLSVIIVVSPLTVIMKDQVFDIKQWSCIYIILTSIVTAFKKRELSSVYVTT